MRYISLVNKVLDKRLPASTVAARSFDLFSIPVAYKISGL